MKYDYAKKERTIFLDSTKGEKLSDWLVCGVLVAAGLIFSAHIVSFVLR